MRGIAQMDGWSLQEMMTRLVTVLLLSPLPLLILNLVEMGYADIRKELNPFSFFSVLFIKPP